MSEERLLFVKSHVIFCIELCPLVVATLSLGERVGNRINFLDLISRTEEFII